MDVAPGFLCGIVLSGGYYSRCTVVSLVVLDTRKREFVYDEEKILSGSISELKNEVDQIVENVKQQFPGVRIIREQ